MIHIERGIKMNTLGQLLEHCVCMCGYMWWNNMF